MTQTPGNYGNDIKQMLTKQQQEKIYAGFESMNLQLTSEQDTLSGLGTDIVELRSRVTCLEDESCGVRGECQQRTSVAMDMGGRLQEDIKVIDDKMDKLETFWRRDNLQFFGIRESENETLNTCTQNVVDVLQGTVADKVWSVSLFVPIG